LNNEPVAYINKDDGLVCAKCFNPLYTDPAKTLTDEEIINIIERLIAKWTDEFKNYEYDSDESEENKLRNDVFAILRKAQEK
jgi:hypothetical protein